MKQTKTAKGMKGTLLSIGDGVLIFRQYDKNGDFIDYYVRNCDLDITINDEDAFVKHDAELDEYYIDHSDQTLGK